MQIEFIFIILSLSASLFWWIQVYYAFLQKIKEQKYITTDEIPTISVIIPAYNEKQESVNKTVRSIINQKNITYEVMIVDDGSDDPISAITHPNVKLIRLEQNKGKRFAQMTGIQIAQYEWIATVDSDTIIEENALFELFNAAKNQKVDAITGAVFLSNEKQNLLTRMTAGMYWFSFFQERASQGYFGSVTCCSGALSLYKRNIWVDHKSEYLSQSFFGSPCVTGDDRHITSLFLLSGYKVGWTGKAIAYTDSPFEIRPFFKQQLRWIRSNIVALFYLFPRIKNWRFMFGLFTMKMLFVYGYMISIYIYMLYCSFSEESLLPMLITLCSILIVTFVKSLVSCFYIGKKVFYMSLNLLLFSLFSFFVFNPLMIYGMFTPSKSGWLTRTKKSLS